MNGIPDNDLTTISFGLGRTSPASSTSQCQLLLVFKSFQNLPVHSEYKQVRL